MEEKCTKEMQSKGKWINGYQSAVASCCVGRWLVVVCDDENSSVALSTIFSRTFSILSVLIASGVDYFLVSYAGYIGTGCIVKVRKI
jgi:hypothetical protein